MWWIAVIALALCALFTSATYLIHYYDRSHRGEATDTTFRDYLGSIAFETASAFATLITYPLGWFSLPAERRYQDDGEPVLLVHGYALNRGSWLAIRLRLGRLGYRNIYTLNLSPLSAGIEQYSEQLGRRVEEVVALCGRPISAIGHDIGGLVLRYYAGQTGGRRLQKIITLGTPHAGNRLGGFMYGGSGPQVKRNSDFMVSLASVGFKANLYAIYSNMDNLVLPNTSGACDKAERNFPVEGAGHFGLLYSNEVWEIIALILTGSTTRMENALQPA